MLRSSQLFTVFALAALPFACGEDKDPLATAGTQGVLFGSDEGGGAAGGETNGDETNGGETNGGEPSSGEPTSGEPTGGDSGGVDPTGAVPGVPSEVCQDYIKCIAVTTPGELPDTQAGFGEGSICWSGTPADAELCGTACATGIEQQHEVFPDEPACDPCALGGECPTGDGVFLLAISTPIDPGLPFQFLVEATVPVTPDGTLELKSVQALSLTQGSVTQPREPVGETFFWGNIQVANNFFNFGILDVTIPIEANPIFGVEVVVEGWLEGVIMSPDMFCGTMTGEVVAPLMQSIEGSTYAAVRVDPAKLPADVTIDCDGQTVSGF